MVMLQQKYIGELMLEKFEMKDCNSISNPSETNSKLVECSEEEKWNQLCLDKLLVH